MRLSRFSVLKASFFIGILFLHACSTIQPTKEKGPSDNSMDADKEMSKNEQQLNLLLDRTRDVLAVAEENEQLEVPEAFREEGTGSTNSSLKNPYQGYRIQLISTRDVKEADERAEKFDEWIEEALPSYQANSYVVFQQPHYKVHVGDFYNRSRAIKFTKLVKEAFPGAWIVPDRIEPSGVAADSVDFRPDTKDLDLD